MTDPTRPDSGLLSVLRSPLVSEHLLLLCMMGIDGLLLFDIEYTEDQMQK